MKKSIRCLTRIWVEVFNYVVSAIGLNLCVSILQKNGEVFCEKSLKKIQKQTITLIRRYIKFCLNVKVKLYGAHN